MTNVLFGAGLNALFSAGNVGKTGNFPLRFTWVMGKKGKTPFRGFPVLPAPFPSLLGFTWNTLKKAKTGEQGQRAIFCGQVTGGFWGGWTHGGGLWTV